MLVALAREVEKGSTGAVYARFDELGGGAGFERAEGRAARALAGVRRPPTSPRFRRTTSPRLGRRGPLAAELLAAGAFRADVSGAGPAVYGLFEAAGERARRRADWPSGKGLGRCTRLVTSPA